MNFDFFLPETAKFVTSIYLDNTISFPRYAQVCLSGLRLERYFFHHDGRSISHKVAHLNIFVHGVIDLLYYEH